MKFQHFTLLADAQAYNTAQTALMNLPAGGVTTTWATPILLADGTYAMPAYDDDTAVAWDPSWILPTPPGLPTHA